ncbi:MAG TPA: 3-deoxy-manno-octulosonate cytidylyltransferase [Planctomycetes bacterium]|jgi:3-deoxy-manno-octulosonate cytidylyltransferase (CMP-KDO synthetase)|nr:3-deoxy-manno-octulosonate cytidylyltransferase [Planctomycetota bacterium]
MSSSPRLIVVVPARRASTRLPDKLLLADSGRPLLVHTLQQCEKAKLPDLVVAAVDDVDLQTVACDAGFQAVMTDPNLPSGTDRVWAAAQQYPSAEFIVNVQGDEAEIDPDVIDLLCQALLDGSPTATLSAPLADEQRDDPDAVKVVTAINGNALYFSRSAVPFVRGEDAGARLHVGIYGFQRKYLKRFAELAPSPLEMCEKLEQLRLLENDIAMRVIKCAHAGIGIDTRRDYDMFLQRHSTSLPNND